MIIVIIVASIKMTISSSESTVSMLHPVSHVDRDQSRFLSMVTCRINGILVPVLVVSQSTTAATMVSITLTVLSSKIFQSLRTDRVKFNHIQQVNHSSTCQVYYCDSDISSDEWGSCGSKVRVRDGDLVVSNTVWRDVLHPTISFAEVSS